MCRPRRVEWQSWVRNPDVPTFHPGLSPPHSSLPGLQGGTALTTLGRRKAGKPEVGVDAAGRVELVLDVVVVPSQGCRHSPMVWLRQQPPFPLVWQCRLSRVGKGRTLGLWVLPFGWGVFSSVSLLSISPVPRHRELGTRPSA